MKFYIIAISPQAALSNLLNKDYYIKLDDPELDLKEFSKEWHKLFEINIPIKEIKI